MTIFFFGLQMRSKMEEKNRNVKNKRSYRISKKSQSITGKLINFNKLGKLKVNEIKMKRETKNDLMKRYK